MKSNEIIMKENEMKWINDNVNKIMKEILIMKERK